MTQQALIEPAPALPAAAPDEPAGARVAASGPEVAEETLVAEELLVEEVSIDGMCGVY